MGLRLGRHRLSKDDPNSYFLEPYLQTIQSLGASAGAEPEPEPGQGQGQGQGNLIAQLQVIFALNLTKPQLP